MAWTKPKPMLKHEREEWFVYEDCERERGVWQ